MQYNINNNSNNININYDFTKFNSNSVNCNCKSLFSDYSNNNIKDNNDNSSSSSTCNSTDYINLITQCNQINGNCIHSVRDKSTYRGKQWPEDTSVTNHFDSKWKIQAWTKYNKLQTTTHKIHLFADTGATISACNDKYARKHYMQYIKKRKSYLPVRVANGAIIKLKEYINLPIFDNQGKYRFSHEFYLIPQLKHKFLASFYFLQKVKFKFSSDIPLLTEHTHLQETQYEHPEEPDETFGKCNNWNEPRLKTNVKQTDYTQHPQFKPHSKLKDNEYANYIKMMELMTNTEWKYYDRQDFTSTRKYKPTPIVTDPYHNKIKSYNLTNYTSLKDVNLNTLNKVKYKDMDIPQSYISVSDRLCHISNYSATTEELKRAAQLADQRTFNKVNLKHVKEISINLYKRCTKLLYHTLDELFAKHQTQLRSIPKYEFKIDLTDDAPARIFIKQYPLSSEKRLVVIHHANQNVKNGLFIPNNTSPHNVPIIVINKGKSNRQRLAYSLQLLNKYTKTVKSHMPSYNYIFEVLRGPGKYTTTDLKNFFENIALRFADQQFAHVFTPIGEFNLTHATYGFKNIMTLAQDISNHLVRPLKRSIAFVDDIIKKHDIDATPAQLYQDIYELFTRANEIGLLLNPEKTYLFADEVEYLGYIFNQLGVIPRPEYIQKVLKFHPPKSKKEIQQYVAVLNYIARFIPNLAQYTQKIIKITHKDKAFAWSTEQQHAFDKIQSLVQKMPLLAHPTPEGEFLVQTDASKYAMAGVLYQRQINRNTQKYEWKIIEFYSKQFDKQLIDHPIMVKECLAITYALNHWQHFLLRKKFFVDTDHRNLISLYDSDEMKAANMKKKQMFVTMRNAIAQFHFQIAHLKGTQIPLPDYLTRDGSLQYQTAPEYINKREETLHLLNATLQIPKFQTKTEKKQYKETIHYMEYIRRNQIEFPPSNQHYTELSTMEFNRKCIRNEINYIDEIDPLKQDLIKDRLTYMSPDTPESALNRWLKEETDEIPPNNPNQYGIPKSQKIYSINSISQSNKRVKFNLTPKYTKSKIDKIKSPKSILRNSKIKNYMKSSNHTKIEKLFDANYRVFEHYINDALETAFINRFHNQYDNKDTNLISSDTVADTHNLFALQKIKSPKPKTTTINSIENNEIIEQPIQNPEHNPNQQNQKRSENYFKDEHGNRRSQRNRKPPKKFYEAFFKENSETENARDHNHKNKNNNQQSFHTQDTKTKLSKKQKERQKKEKRFQLTPQQTHNLFKSLYKDVHRADQLDPLLSPTKLLIHQQNDPICQIIRDHIEQAIPQTDKRYQYLKRYYNRIHTLLIQNKFYINNNNLICLKSNTNNTNSTDRLYIPTNLIRIALQYIHKSSHFTHPGITQTQMLIKNKFYWYKWQSDSQRYVSQCPECQLAKGHKYHLRGKLAPIITKHFNETIHLDFLGPFHSALNVLLITDNYTGYTMLIPTFGQTADDVIQAIWNHWRPINGLPRKCLTDRGKGFISELNQRFYSIFGIKGLFTSGYHAQTNAKAERRVQEAKKAIRMINTTLNGELTHKHNSKNAVNSIKLLLPSIQFELNQKPFTFSGISPNMLIRGENLNDTIDVAAALSKLAKTAKMKKFKDSKQTLKMLKRALTEVKNQFNQQRWYYVQRTIKNYDKNRKDDTFDVNDKVVYYVGERNYPMKKIRPRFTGPFTIIKRINHNTVTIYNESTQEELSCHTQKLKKYNVNQFTEENDYLRQLKSQQKLNNEYRRKKGNKRQKL